MGLAVSSGRNASKLPPRQRLAFAICDAAQRSNVLLARSSAPRVSESDGDDLARFCDSDLWELPCYDLSELVQHQVQLRGSISQTQFVCSLEAALGDAGLKGFDVLEAVEMVQSLVPSPLHFCSLWKLVAEPDFGPKDTLHTAIVIVEAPRFAASDGGANTEWFDSGGALELLVNATPGADRIGVLAAQFFYESFPEGICCDLKLGNATQEYPPGILVTPMTSRTLKPFSKTNLVICAPSSSGTLDHSENGSIIADALIVDPGCSVPAYEELVAIVRSLPRRLMVFITHHHLDHTEGLPAIAQENDQAFVVAHERTLQRMGSVLSGMNCLSVTGWTKIFIRGQLFEIIPAPGHTDGHLCLFHYGTRTVVAGDHCVGEGSSILDANSGGNLHDYMSTSNRLLELAPKLVVPMHGRPNFWPSQLIKGYIKHRQAREATILKAIEAGATSAFDIVSSAYKQTHVTLWPAALLNVKSHVEHLQKHNKLPQDFSVEKFRHSCGLAFKLRWFSRLVSSNISRTNLLTTIVVLGGIGYYFWQSGGSE